MADDMTPRERGIEAAKEYVGGARWALANLIERAILADRIAERARLTQSSITSLANEFAEIDGRRDYLSSTIYSTRFILARHVQAKLRATDEAARIEARDAIADYFFRHGIFESAVKIIRDLRPDELMEKKP